MQDGEIGVRRGAHHGEIGARTGAKGAESAVTTGAKDAESGAMSGAIRRAVATRAGRDSHWDSDSVPTRRSASAIAVGLTSPSSRSDQSIFPCERLGRPPQGAVACWIGTSAISNFAHLDAGICHWRSPAACSGAHPGITLPADGLLGPAWGQNELLAIMSLTAMLTAD